MPKKKPKKIWTAPTPTPKRKLSTALVVVDNAPLLKGYRASYQKVLKNIAQSEGQLQRHQTDDAPKFERWYHSTFGEQLTALRQGEEEIQRLTSILAEVDRLMMSDGCSEVIAYHRIKLREQGLPDPYEKPPKDARPDPLHDDLPDDADPFFDEGGEYDDWDPFAEFVKQQAEAYKKATGKLPPGYDDIMRQFGIRTEAPKPPSNHKQIYRQIVTRLHPDRAGKFSPIEQALWHEAQTAYKDGNTSALEIILARCEAAQDGVEITRASLIVGMIQQGRISLAELRAQLRRCREHPSWNFAKRKDTAALLKKIMAQFRYELGHQKSQLSHVRREATAMEERYERWREKEAKRKESQKPKPPKMVIASPHQAELW